MQIKIEKKKITSGTKEWASSNVNLYSGCSNNCFYCYAKKMAIRFNRKTEETWSQMELNEKALNKSYGKRRGRIMFPTSHDITPENVDNCIIVLKKLLRSQNEVLIVSKPNLECIKKLTRALLEFRNQIEFRFTITSNLDYTLKLWEPGAPVFLERLRALIVAFNAGFKTSVSNEPFLDLSPIPLIFLVNPYVTGTIWVGKLNYCKKDPNGKKIFFNSWDNIQYVIHKLKDLPEDIKSKIRIKDSIKNLYAKKGVELKL